jgi:hypothetical protein
MYNIVYLCRYNNVPGTVLYVLFSTVRMMTILYLAACIISMASRAVAKSCHRDARAILRPFWPLLLLAVSSTSRRQLQILAAWWRAGADEGGQVS